jgi:hypothetical protein|tara:strand:+ start:1690 stop:2127 length:438 start_codon:yes stop_codon:yes gene_type:complete
MGYKQKGYTPFTITNTQSPFTKASGKSFWSRAKDWAKDKAQSFRDSAVNVDNIVGSKDGLYKPKQDPKLQALLNREADRMEKNQKLTDPTKQKQVKKIVEARKIEKNVASNKAAGPKTKKQIASSKKTNFVKTIKEDVEDKVKKS